MHNVAFGTSPGGGLFLEIGPYKVGGPWVFGQFKIAEHGGGERMQGVVIPYADGLKDAGDGARAEETLTVEGFVHTAEQTAETNALGIVSDLQGRTNFYVWNHYDTGNGDSRPLYKLQSWRVGEAPEWGGERWDVSLTFAIYEPS